jgi:hypothetical protein
MANLSNINNKLVVTTDGAALINQGTVDYGTAKLQVSGSGSTGTITWRNDGGRKTGYLYSDSAGVAIYSTTLNNAGIYLADNIHIDFRVNGGVKMLIDSSGNVGIGVTAGTYLSSIRALRIGQGASFSAFTTSLNTYVSSNVRVDASGNNKAIVTGESAQYRQSDGTHIWYNAASVSAGATSTLTERMRITSGGNVGIGTTLPQSILSLSKTDEASYTPATAVDYSLMLGTRNGNAAGTSDDLGPGIVWKYNDAGGSYTKKSAGIMQVGEGNYLRSGLAFYTNNNADQTTVWSEKMRLSMDGNVGIGTTSPDAKLHIYGSASLSEMYLGEDAAADKAGILKYTQGNGSGTGVITLSHWGNSSLTEGLAVKYGGNVGIGTTTPNLSSNGTYGVRVLTVGGDVAGYPGVLELASVGYAGTGGNMGQIQFVNGTSRNASISSHPETNVLDNAFLDFNTKQTGVALALRMRITSVGHILFNTTSTSLTSGLGFKFINDGAAPYMGIVANSSSATGNTNYHYYNTNAAYNGFRFYIANNGGIYNFSANNVNLSDERVKHNIENSGNYLDKICSIPVRLFNYKDEPEGTDKNLGVIAQEVEAVAPELVNNDGFGETPEDGIELKTVYSTDMMYALMKSIQELEARIKILENK